MSSLGQLAGRLDRNLKLVGDLSKALIALRADVLDKTELLKVTGEKLEESRQMLAAFLADLLPVLDGGKDGAEEHKIIRERLLAMGQQPTDWVADFRVMHSALCNRERLSIDQLNKISQVVGFLQGEVAEDVRRLRSR